VKYTLHVRYATLRYATHVYYFFGSFNRLQLRRLHGFSRLIR